MIEIIVSILILILILIIFRAFSTMESRVIKAIYFDAQKQKIKIKTLRDPLENDGVNPLYSVIKPSLISGVLGYFSEQTIFKIIETSKGKKYWVRVYTTLFVSIDIVWKVST